MEFRVQFDNQKEVVIDATYPSVAAIESAQRLGLQGDRTCSVMEPGGYVTHWRVSLLEHWYARPLDKILSAPSTKCKKAPRGWSCSRDAGHSGPCAATPVPSGRATQVPR